MFKPDAVYIEKDALEYEVGRKINHLFKNSNMEVVILTGNRMKSLPKENLHEYYHKGKRTLVVSVRRSLKFQTCKPSAHYQLPLVTGCMGGCEYCYLQTRFSSQPFTRVYVNVAEILEQAAGYISQRNDTTIFEGAAVSDPIPVEPYTGALAQAISFFGQKELARFTFVTKYTDIDNLLTLKHNGHTTIRFSVNLPGIINKFEHRTPNLEARLKAAQKVLQSEYPLGLIIAPVFLDDDWQRSYGALLSNIAEKLGGTRKPIVLEVISHRFTAKAKETILQLYPDSELPLDEETRNFKFGQFGYGKYLYPKDMLREMKTFFEEWAQKMGENWSIKYII